MENILIIGNSFAAALKQSETASMYPAQFLGGSGNVLNDLVLTEDSSSLKLGGESARSEQQQKLWALTTGSAAPLSLSTFTQIVVVGLIGPPNALLRVNCPQIATDDTGITNGQVPISFAMYRLISPYRQSVERAQRFMTMLRTAVSHQNILFVPQPHIRVDADTFDTKYALPRWWLQLTAEEKEYLRLNQNALYNRLYEEKGVKVLIPKAELVVEGDRCPAQFSTGALGSENFGIGVRPQWGDSPRETPMNFNHKNAEYGSIIWGQINSAIDIRKRSKLSETQNAA